MGCEWTEQVSMLIDGELPSDEAARVRAHLGTCLACRAAHNDFLHLRGEIKARETTVDPTRRRRTLEAIRGSSARVRGRTFAVPAPAFIGLILVVFVFGAAAGVWLRDRRSPRTVSTPPPSVQIAEPSDFSGFDGGGRTTLLVVKKSQLNGTGGKS